MRIGDLGVEGGHQLAMLQLQQDFGQPGNPSGTFSVPGVVDLTEPMAQNCLFWV